MILPSKQLGQDRALISVGGEILRLLDEPKTVSRLWEELRQTYIMRYGSLILTYDWFILSLDLLYALGIVELASGRLRRNLQ